MSWRSSLPFETLTADDLRSRQPVWEALAELWLDTELQRNDIEHIARVLAESPFSIEQLQDIHRDEVAPAVCTNLASVAGEWAGFDTEWLLRRCEDNARRKHRLLPRLRVRLRAAWVRRFTAGHFAHVIALVQALRARTEASS